MGTIGQVRTMIYQVLVSRHISVITEVVHLRNLVSGVQQQSFPPAIEQMSGWYRRVGGRPQRPTAVAPLTT